MPLIFDATVKDLGRISPVGMVTTFDQPPTLPVKLFNVDLSTVTSATDLVYGLGDPLQEIVHLDFQGRASATKHADVLAYNGLLHRQYLVPVHSILVLLHPQAAHSNMTGQIRYSPRGERGKMDFGYEVVRLWERSAEELLAGDVALTPFATLGRLPEGLELKLRLGVVIDRLIQRVLTEAPADLGRRLLTAAFLLTGIRIPRLEARQLFRGATRMFESDTYMGIIDEGRDEGRLEEARRLVLRLGQQRFGPPSEELRSALTALADLDRVERIFDRLLTATDWQDLISTP